MGASPSDPEGAGTVQMPRKPTFIVHWPEEMAGADYQKVALLSISNVLRFRL